MTSPGALPADQMLPLNGVPIDGSLYRSVTTFAGETGWLHPFMLAYTTLGIVVLATLLAVTWWNARNRDLTTMTAVLWSGCGTLVCVGAGLTLKEIFAEPRPCLAIAHITTVEACPGPTDYSFPSNHTTIATAIAVGVWLTSRKLGLIAIVLTLLEGFSRVYLGQHYPHDVLASLALSTFIILVGWPLTRRPLGHLVHLLSRTPLRFLVTSTR